jgi:hypothetical protein
MEKEAYSKTGTDARREATLKCMLAALHKPQKKTADKH